MQNSPHVSPAPPLVQHTILGIRVSAINMDLALAQIDAWITQRLPRYVCVAGVHGLVECQDDPQLWQIFNQAGLVTPDGMPLVWLMRMAGQRQVERVYGPDLMLAIFAISAQRGYRHFFYGGAPGVPERLAARLQTRFPATQIVGTYSPPFRPLTLDEDAELLERINTAAPQIVWVGLSTPKQERWMAAYVERLNPVVLIGVGAAFDFHAGLKPQAPRWVQRSGFEWLFRMLSEPRRLAGRYLKNNPRFLYLIARQWLARTDDQ